MSYDRQCPSCGGFCGSGKCKVENVKPEQQPVAWRIADERDWEYCTKPPLETDIQWSARYGRKYEPLYASPPSRKPEQKPLRRGDRLKCMESGEYAIVWATSRSGKTIIQWADRGFGEYTEEQIGEHFWIVPEVEQDPVAWLSQGGDVSRSKKHFDEMGFVDSIPLYTSPAAFTPLADEAIHQLFKHLPSENRDGWVVAFARAIERIHGIGGEA